VHTLLSVLVVVVAACGSDGSSAPVDAPSDCDPATVLPSNYRLIAMVSSGAVQVAASGDVTSGTIDATAGGLMNAADNPYIYVDLKGAKRIDVNDLDARSSKAWDVALKRSSLRVNGGDSGAGKRELAVVQAATLAEVTAGPSDGYATDDFTTDDCMLDSIPGGEPRSSFGEWYGYDDQTHMVTPKPEVFVIQRDDGSRTALRLAAYYGDPAAPMKGAFYAVEWKQLPSR
jgi:hypothetical protein